VQRLWRKQLRAAWLALVSLAALCAAQTTHAGVVVHNLMPDFWRFWEQAQHEPPERQLALWRALYVKPNSAVFADLAGPCAKHFADSALEKEFLPTLPELIPEIRSLGESLPGIIKRARLGFQRTFPDMNWSGDIYIMASAGCFNGRSQLVQGREALLLGLDDIAQLHETNLPPLLDHELFHRYQHPYFAFEPGNDEPLWTRLWAEGMATYVSRRLNPSASNTDTLWISDADVQKMDDRKAAIAADFLAHFDSTSKVEAALYFLDDESKDANIPARAGYWLGLRVAEELGRQYPLGTMAHWNREQAEAPIRKVLETLETKQ
jgi:hypothetical protein